MLTLPSELQALFVKLQRPTRPLQAGSQGPAARCVSWSSSFRCARMLLEAGASPNITTALDGYTPLMRACKEGNLEIVRRLLDSHADINLQTTAGVTALYEACCHREGVPTEISTSITKMLLDQGPTRETMLLPLLMGSRASVPCSLVRQKFEDGGKALEYLGSELSGGASPPRARKPNVGAVSTPEVVVPYWQRVLVPSTADAHCVCLLA